MECIKYTYLGLFTSASTITINNKNSSSKHSTTIITVAIWLVPNAITRQSTNHLYTSCLIYHQKTDMSKRCEIEDKSAEEAITLLTGEEHYDEEELKSFLRGASDDHLQKIEKIMEDMIAKRTMKLQELSHNANSKRKESRSFKKKIEFKSADIEKGKAINSSIMCELKRRVPTVQEAVKLT